VVLLSPSRKTTGLTVRPVNGANEGADDDRYRWRSQNSSYQFWTIRIAGGAASSPSTGAIITNYSPSAETSYVGETPPGWSRSDDSKRCCGSPSVNAPSVETEIAISAASPST
jgi:hypothetical protein